MAQEDAAVLQALFFAQQASPPPLLLLATRLISSDDAIGCSSAASTILRFLEPRVESESESRTNFTWSLKMVILLNQLCMG